MFYKSLVGEYEFSVLALKTQGDVKENRVIAHIKICFLFKPHSPSPSDMIHDDKVVGRSGGYAERSPKSLLDFLAVPKS